MYLSQIVQATDKVSLRQALRRARRALSPAHQRKAAQAASLRLLRSHWFKNSRHIAFYWPGDGEISPLPLMRTAWRLGKTCYLPVVDRAGLTFRPCCKGDRLYPNRFGIPEPGPRLSNYPLTELDLVLVPLVGFDQSGNRLGMGAGFYDRVFSRANRAGKPWRVGLAHELQKVAALPLDPWDVPLHAVVTDRACYSRGVWQRTE